MIETFVRLIDGRREGTNSTWQGILTFTSNAPVQALAPLAVRSAPTQPRIVVEDHEWRFMIFNRKFNEYCDVIGVERERRMICDGDKFEIFYTPRDVPLNLWPSASTAQVDRDERNGTADDESNVREHQSLAFLQSALARQSRPNGRVKRAPTRNHEAANSNSLANNNDGHEFSNRATTIFAEIHPRSPLVFTDNQPDIKPSLEFLQRLTSAVRRVSSSSPSDSGDTRLCDLLPQTRRFARHRRDQNHSPLFDDNSTFSSRQASVEGSSRKRPYASGDESAALSGLRNPEDAPCTLHAADPESCSHTRFRNIDAAEVLRRSNQSDLILEHLQLLAEGDGTIELDQTVRCKLMNIIGHYLMLHADALGLPTAVERRILVSSFLSQLPYQLDPKIFTNRAGTGCLDYWVRNRRKTTLREDGVFMVRGSKRRTVPKNSDFVLSAD